jgi:hypothetical protein
MTEEEWLNCTKPREMLRFLIGKVSDRKLRLLACAHYRQRPEHMSSQTAIQAQETIEAWGDGEASYEAVCQQVEELQIDPAGPHDQWNRTFRMLISMETFNQFNLISHMILELFLPEIPADHASAPLADYVRCIFGNPIPQLESCAKAPTKSSLLIKLAQGVATGLLKFMGSSPFNTSEPDTAASRLSNPVISYAADPTWLSSTVLALARGIYEERAFDRMPILADALQDSGCDDRAILDHCRSDSCVHARGCFVVDLLLGKS